ncbi:LuxR C-terminal-related transcriptional regulator [Nocardia alni]|uniref:LuxR C-terminal-related transcriptional regulator n=1 Tax=Nocardia alni TaxID=2815723 RepID=UPI0027DF1373|nr:LuxR C-terminal-related transcriptional regulator [Nocardia alni]
MVGSIPVAVESLPGARDLLREMESQSADPRAHLLRGRSGTGKSTLLGVIRNRVRARGGIVYDTLEEALAATEHPASPAVLILDNVHRLSRVEVEKICAAISSVHCGILIAVRPCPHDTALRTLADTVARHGRVVDLRTLGVGDIGPFARELGMTVPRPVALHVHRQTAGIPGGVVAALAAACATRLGQGIGAVDTAVTAWSRTMLDDADPDLLEVFVIATTGVGLDAGELAEVLGTSHGAARDLIDRARATALVTDADLLLPQAETPLRTLVGDRRYLAVLRRLLQARLAAGLLRERTALVLAESGVDDPRLAQFLCAAAEKTGAEAARYYAAAARSGADRQSIALRWAEAAARVGDGDTALRLAEPVLDQQVAPYTEWAAAVRICAGVWTRRGLVDRAVQLYSWLGTDRVGADWAVGATVSYLAGAAEMAAAFSASADRWPPTEATVRSGRIVAALAQSIDLSGRSAAVAAASSLVQTARADGAPADRSTARFLPCDAVTVATLLCLSMGDPGRAADALHGDLESDATRAVLGAWTAMLSGDEQSAATLVAPLDLAALPARERLLGHGVRVGLARRAGDQAALALAWQSAYPMFDDVGADLLALLPIGELWLASIRLHDEARPAALVDAARKLLDRLDNPPAWANAFHWYAIQAAIAGEHPDESLPSAQRLEAAARAGDPQAAALAEAGRTWISVLHGQIAQDRVTAAARGLADLGLTWDAARVAGEAAVAGSDAATCTALAELAYAVRFRARSPQNPQHPPAAPQPQTVPGTALSEREREVAELVLLGLTYREIGARLYISAKTVEHHVARIRRRIGAGSRSELLSMLRAMGHGSLLV